MTLNFVLNYVNDTESVVFLANNCAPLMFKILDYADARRDYDCSNIVLLGLEVMYDFELLFENLGFELGTNKKDLKYEKFIASMRLGSLVDSTKSPEKFAKFLSNVEKIENVSLNGKTYEQGVKDINSLLLEGYKDLNLDLIPTSDQASLVSVSGLGDLVSRSQAYSFELRKARSNDSLEFIDAKIQSDYGNNYVFVNSITLDMVLTNNNTKQVVNSLDSPVAITLSIENLSSKTDIKIYRYDTVNSKVIALANEKTASNTDYFAISSDISFCILHLLVSTTLCVLFANTPIIGLLFLSE